MCWRVNLYPLTRHRFCLRELTVESERQASRWPVLPHGKPLVQMDGALQKETRESNGKGPELGTGPKG